MLMIQKRRDFLAAAKHCDKFFTEALVMQIRNRGDAYQPRLGITATKKVGNAVVRNRAKRRLRALAAEVLVGRAKTGYDYVLIARATTPSHPWRDMCRGLNRTLNRFDRQLAEIDPCPEQ